MNVSDRPAMSKRRREYLRTLGDFITFENDEERELHMQMLREEEEEGGIPIDDDDDGDDDGGRREIAVSGVAGETAEALVARMKRRRLIAQQQQQTRQGSDDGDGVDASSGDESDPERRPVRLKDRRVLTAKQRMMQRVVHEERGIAALAGIVDRQFNKTQWNQSSASVVGKERHVLRQLMLLVAKWAKTTLPELAFDDAIEWIEQSAGSLMIREAKDKLRGLHWGEETTNGGAGVRRSARNTAQEDLQYDLHRVLNDDDDDDNGGGDDFEGTTRMLEENEPSNSVVEPSSVEDDGEQEYEFTERLANDSHRKKSPERGRRTSRKRKTSHDGDHDHADDENRRQDTRAKSAARKGRKSRRTRRNDKDESENSKQEEVFESEQGAVPPTKKRRRTRRRAQESEQQEEEEEQDIIVGNPQPVNNETDEQQTVETTRVRRRRRPTTSNASGKSTSVAQSTGTIKRRRLKRMREMEESSE